MAERDIPQYAVEQTNTSALLGNTSYPVVEADLTQDFGLQRVSRGLDQITLSITYQVSGKYIDPDSNYVKIDVSDPYGNAYISTTETRSSTGCYYFAFTPPVSSQLGTYKAVHSATIGTSGLITEDFFKVVSSAPGSFYGKVVRGEDTVVIQLSNEASQAIDAGTLPTCNIYSPTGVLISSGVSDSTYTYRYAPGYNDTDGEWQAVFTYLINGLPQQEYQFFTVVRRREENIITVEELKACSEGLRIKSKISALSNDDLDAYIADSQAMASLYIRNSISPKYISGEKCPVTTDDKGFLFLRPARKNITKIVRCILRFHPQVSITLPVSGFIFDGDTGTIKYIYASGLILPGSIRGLLNEYSFYNYFEAILDYETGYINDELIMLKKAVRLLAVDTIMQGYGLVNAKSLTAGNYKEEYYDQLRDVGKKTSQQGFSLYQKQAFVILDKFKRAPII